MVARDERHRLLARLALLAAVGLSTACGQGLRRDPFPPPSGPESDAHDAGDASQDGSDGPDHSSPQQDSRVDIDTVDASNDREETSDFGDASAYDYYVDSLAEEGGDGTRAKPFKTITAAVAAHAKSSRAERAWVAPGAYDEALGEKFPLLLRGLSLDGSGQDKTIVVGTGTLNHSDAGGSANGVYQVTLVVGDPSRPTRISNLTVKTQAEVPTEGAYGIFCDRGNAGTGFSQGETVLDRIVAGPGYHVAVFSGTSTQPSSGCNLRITASTLTRSWTGVYGVGCGLEESPGPPVAVTMGEDGKPESGNLVSFTYGLGEAAYGVLLQACVLSGGFYYNTIIDGLHGINIDDRSLPTSAKNAYIFKHNRFERLVSGGIMMHGPSVYIEELSDNTFVNVSRAVRAGDKGNPAVAVWSDLFHVGKVRRNTFVGNDSAMWFWNMVGTGLVADLGTADDPGLNVFRCNSGVTAQGADVWIVGASNDPEAGWGGTVHLAGNSWDHVPPTVNTPDPYTNGVDIGMGFAPHVTLDLSGASLATEECPPNHGPGLAQ
jgi:hypothetical protein